MAVAPTFRAYFMGLWSVLVGVFLLGAATSVVRSVRPIATVRDAMAPPVSLDPDLPIHRFVDEILPMHRFASFPVAHDRRLLGILSLEDLKKIPRERWRGLRAREVMRAVNSSLFVRDADRKRKRIDRTERIAVAVVRVQVSWLAAYEGSAAKEITETSLPHAHFRDNPSGASVNCGVRAPPSAGDPFRQST
jgi:CBS domain-containing protein